MLSIYWMDGKGKGRVRTNNSASFIALLSLQHSTSTRRLIQLDHQAPSYFLLLAQFFHARNQVRPRFSVQSMEQHRQGTALPQSRPNLRAPPPSKVEEHTSCENCECRDSSKPLSHIHVCFAPMCRTRNCFGSIPFKRAYPDRWRGAQIPKEIFDPLAYS